MFLKRVQTLARLERPHFNSIVSRTRDQLIYWQYSNTNNYIGVTEQRLHTFQRIQVPHFDREVVTARD